MCVCVRGNAGRERTQMADTTYNEHTDDILTDNRTEREIDEGETETREKQTGKRKNSAQQNKTTNGIDTFEYFSDANLVRPSRKR